MFMKTSFHNTVLVSSYLNETFMVFDDYLIESPEDGIDILEPTSPLQHDKINGNYYNHVINMHNESCDPYYNNEDLRTRVDT